MIQFAALHESGYGSLADIGTPPLDVRFATNSGHEIAIRDLWNLMSALAQKMSAIIPTADIDQ